jgi:hypothetical protein
LVAITILVFQAGTPVQSTVEATIATAASTRASMASDQEKALRKTHGASGNWTHRGISSCNATWILMSF